MDAVEYTAFTVDLAMKHQSEFGERLDTRALTHEALKNKRTLEQEYQHQFGAKYAEKAQKTQQALIDQKVQEGVAAALKARGGVGPYPIGPELGSPLDALEPIKGSLSMDELEAEYHAAVTASK